MTCVNSITLVLNLFKLKGWLNYIFLSNLGFMAQWCHGNFFFTIETVFWTFVIGKYIFFFYSTTEVTLMCILLLSCGCNIETAF